MHTTEYACGCWENIYVIPLENSTLADEPCKEFSLCKQHWILLPEESEE